MCAAMCAASASSASMADFFFFARLFGRRAFHGSFRWALRQLMRVRRHSFGMSARVSSETSTSPASCSGGRTCGGRRHEALRSFRRPSHFSSSSQDLEPRVRALVGVRGKGRFTGRLLRGRRRLVALRAEGGLRLGGERGLGPERAATLLAAAPAPAGAVEGDGSAQDFAGMPGRPTRPFVGCQRSATGTAHRSEREGGGVAAS